MAGQVAGFAPFDDDEIFVVYVKEDVAGALKIRFARYSFATDTFSWNVETSCLGQCTTRISGNDYAVIQAEIILSDDKSEARVAYSDSAAIYFMTVDMTDGNTSNVKKLGDLESVNVFNWSKFLSYSVVAFEMDDLETHSLFFYNFESAQYNACKTFSGYYGISEILDGDKLVQIGGLTENSYTIISKINYDECEYDPYHMENLDNYKVYQVSNASSAFVMTSFTETFVAMTADSNSLYSNQGKSSFTLPSDTSEGSNIKMRAYLDDDPINLSYDIGYTGDSNELNNVCFSAVTGDITYQPALTNIEFEADNDISAWATFNSGNTTFTFTLAVEGTYTGKLIYQYEGKGEYSKSVTIKIGSELENSCWNTKSKTSCLVLVVFVSIMSFIVFITICIVLVWIIKKK